MNVCKKRPRGVERARTTGANTPQDSEGISSEQLFELCAPTGPCGKPANQKPAGMKVAGALGGEKSPLLWGSANEGGKASDWSRIQNTAF